MISMESEEKINFQTEYFIEISDENNILGTYF